MLATYLIETSWRGGRAPPGSPALFVETNAQADTALTNHFKRSAMPFFVQFERRLTLEDTDDEEDVSSLTLDAVRNESE